MFGLQKERIDLVDAYQQYVISSIISFKWN